jgi:hypothetical protein
VQNADSFTSKNFVNIITTGLLLVIFLNKFTFSIQMHMDIMILGPNKGKKSLYIPGQDVSVPEG